MYQRILVAIDGSPTGHHAFDAALELAKQNGAELRACHVIENAAIYYNVPGYDPSILRDQLVAQGAQIAKDFTQEIGAAGVKGEVTVSEASALSDVATVVLDTAAEFKADLIVLGTHGRRGFKRLVLGSVAEQCLRQANLPILLIPAAAHPDNKAE
jgi:nucleotide-binding universal stress UspA family protein